MFSEMMDTQGHSDWMKEQSIIKKKRFCRMFIVKHHFERHQKKLVFKVEERRILITLAACLGNNMFD